MVAERGDTIIEVLFAITIFALVSVGGLALMNKGALIAQSSLEINLVRDQVDAQADMLRYINHAYISSYGSTESTATKFWKDILEAEHNIEPGVLKDFTTISGSNECDIPKKGTGGRAFVINPDAVNLIDKANLTLDAVRPMVITDIIQANTYSQVTGNQAQGLWIQAVRHANKDNTRPGYYDFHIRACWITPGNSTPMTIGTIVRLYEPRG